MFKRLCTKLSLILLVATMLASSFTYGELSEQQQRFVSVEKSLKRGNNKAYEQQKSFFDDYPLAPYLEYLYLSNRFKELSQADIDRYVSENPDSPHSSQLQGQWLSHLSRGKRWNNYLSAYDKTGFSGGKYQCLKGAALWHLGQTDSAWEEAEQLWLIGKSQNKACDPLFANWKQAGQLTQKRLYDRFWLSVIESNLSLARYLDQKISNTSYKTSTGLFWEIHQSPHLLAKEGLLDGNKPHHRLMMLHGLKRLSYRNRDKAIDIWLSLRSDFPFTLKQIAKLDKHLALGVAKRFTDNASVQIARLDPRFQYPEVTEWRIRLALTEQNWEIIPALISQLPADKQQSSRWSYWHSVAKVKTSKSASPFSQTASDKIIDLKKHTALNQLSQERNFYAFLVAELSQRPFQLNHEAPVIYQQDLDKLMEQHKGFARIQEWLHHERYYQAQSELNRLNPKLSKIDRKLLPYLAQQWDWHHQAIMSAAKAALWNDLSLRFPSPQSQLFNKHAQLRNLDYTWVLSIARQESAFNPMARSHAGARGLMQLMPATAKQTARQHKIPYRQVSELYKPETNIALGTAHLSWLMARFEGSKAYSTAAYNAGSNAVKRWLNARGHLPLDIWIETIPYDETRRYVQNVLAFSVIYGSRNPDQHAVKMLSPQEMAKLTLAPTSLVAQIVPESQK